MVLIASRPSRFKSGISDIRNETGYDLLTSPYLASAVKAPMIGNGCLLAEL